MAKFRDFEGQYSNTEVGFILIDPRLDIKVGARWLYIVLWNLAVKERRETLPEYYYPKMPQKCDKNAAEMQGKGLISVSDKGAITVYGVRSKHPNLKWKDEVENEVENKKTPLQKEKEKESVPHFLFEQVKQKFNQLCPRLNPVLKITKSRKGHLAARFTEYPELGFWEKLFRRVNESDFMHGQNDRNWVADFDWLIKNDENIPKVLEGKYDNHNGSRPKPVPRQLTDEERETELYGS